MTGAVALAASWSRGLIRRRPMLMSGMALTVAVAVAFVTALGSFVASSQGSLTARAAASVAVDWQVQVTSQGNARAVGRVLTSTPGVRAVLPVSYATVPNLSSVSGGVTRTTAKATVVTLPDRYAALAPKEIRYLVGSRRGVLLQQQTAANLGVTVGDVISVHTSTRTLNLAVNGIVDLPQSDSFFQVVGAPAGAGATAPPDNVVIVPRSAFNLLAGSSTTIDQFHVLFDHRRLPSDPPAAADSVTAAANHFALSVAGGALVGDNLAAALSGAREDAIYARLLFLLLGLPGLALAAIVAALLVGLRSESRRRETALLLLRGADRTAVLAIAAGESLAIGLVGVAIGLLGGEICTHLILGISVSAPWLVTAGVAGAVMSIASQGVPAVRSITRFASESVSKATAVAPSARHPWFLRIGLDVILLVGAALVTWLNAKNGYHVVVVPEGVAVTAVNYGALLGPALAWPGLVFLMWRLTAWFAGRFGSNWRATRPGHAPELVAATVRRRRQIVARGAAVLAAAVGLGLSTGIFTTTYDQQSRLDVALTVGSDVSATALPGTIPRPAQTQVIAATPGVSAVEPLIHRFAYVGPDLQDLYGIRPATIQRAAVLQDAFVPGSTIAGVLAGLTATKDGVLLSAETIRDYQLHIGDQIKLRLPVASSGYQPVTFHVVGQISEFPTAPKDSFIVANAEYVNRATHSFGVSTYLIASSQPAATAAFLRGALGPRWHIQDVTSARTTVVTASGLAATDLGSLARLELGFAFVFACACSGLALGLGIAGRRRSLAVLGALGARPRQSARFFVTEGLNLLLAGIIGGVAIGFAVGYLLVATLRGIFDPPPDGLAFPWGFAVPLCLSAIALGVAVTMLVGRLATRTSPTQLRDL